MTPAIASSGAWRSADRGRGPGRCASASGCAGELRRGACRAAPRSRRCCASICSRSSGAGSRASRTPPSCGSGPARQACGEPLGGIERRRPRRAARPASAGRRDAARSSAARMSRAPPIDACACSREQSLRLVGLVLEQADVRRVRHRQRGLRELARWLERGRAASRSMIAGELQRAEGAASAAAPTRSAAGDVRVIGDPEALRARGPCAGVVDADPRRRCDAGRSAGAGSSRTGPIEEVDAVQTYGRRRAPGPRCRGRRPGVGSPGRRPGGRGPGRSPRRSPRAERTASGLVARAETTFRQSWSP